MEYHVVAMQPSDYDDVAALWQRTDELRINLEFDNLERVTRYLQRNPGLSSIARIDGVLIGALMCGHDGRRGSLYHMAVDTAWRGQGVGRALVERCLTGLRAAGIDSAYLFVHTFNEPAQRFWTHLGFAANHEVLYYWRSL